MFDIVFISYNEPNADANWKHLVERFPYAKRLNGVKGIHKAHKIAAHICMSDMFWVVDGDSIVADNFAFENPKGLWRESVYVYRASNPVNDLSYGYGGIKLLPRKYTLAVNEGTVDMTTNIAPHFTAVDQIASITNFNTDPFSTWRSAFRECAKLSSRALGGQIDTETQQRLSTWQSFDADRIYGEYSIDGAIAGGEYGTANQNNPEALLKINDFEWLRKQYGNRSQITVY